MDLLIFIVLEIPMCHLHKRNLTTYARYCDDIYVITDNNCASTLKKVMTTKGKSFKIVAKAEAQDPQTFLHVEVLKRLGKYGCRCRIKDTSFYAPILAESCHPEQVHISWAKTKKDRVAKFCSYNGDVQECLSSFMKESQSLRPHPILRKCFKTTKWKTTGKNIYRNS